MKNAALNFVFKIVLVIRLLYDRTEGIREGENETKRSIIVYFGIKW